MAILSQAVTATVTIMNAGGAKIITVKIRRDIVTIRRPEDMVTVAMMILIVMAEIIIRRPRRRDIVTIRRLEDMVTVAMIMYRRRQLEDVESR